MLGVGHLSILTSPSILEGCPIVAVASIVTKCPTSGAITFAALKAMGAIMVGSVVFHPSVRPIAIDAGSTKGLHVVLALQLGIV